MDDDNYTHANDIPGITIIMSFFRLDNITNKSILDVEVIDFVTAFVATYRGMFWRWGKTSILLLLHFQRACFGKSKFLPQTRG